MKLSRMQKAEKPRRAELPILPQLGLRCERMPGLPLLPEVAGERQWRPKLPVVEWQALRVRDAGVRQLPQVPQLPDMAMVSARGGHPWLRNGSWLSSWLSSRMTRASAQRMTMGQTVGKPA
jgi:hypothetical protein